MHMCGGGVTCGASSSWPWAGPREGPPAATLTWEWAPYPWGHSHPMASVFQAKVSTVRSEGGLYFPLPRSAGHDF